MPTALLIAGTYKTDSGHPLIKAMRRRLKLPFFTVTILAPERDLDADGEVTVRQKVGILQM